MVQSGAVPSDSEFQEGTYKRIHLCGLYSLLQSTNLNTHQGLGSTKDWSFLESPGMIRQAFRW